MIQTTSVRPRRPPGAPPCAPAVLLCRREAFKEKTVARADWSQETELKEQSQNPAGERGSRGSDRHGRGPGAPAPRNRGNPPGRGWPSKLRGYLDQSCLEGRGLGGLRPSALHRIFRRNRPRLETVARVPWARADQPQSAKPLPRLRAAGYWRPPPPYPCSPPSLATEPGFELEKP